MAIETFGGGLTTAQLQARQAQKSGPRLPDLSDYGSDNDYDYEDSLGGTVSAIADKVPTVIKIILILLGIGLLVAFFAPLV